MKVFIIFLALILVSTKSAKAGIRRCEIKYGETGDSSELEVKHFGKDINEEIKKKYGLECYQIGLEHDLNKKPINEKPIFACCYKL